MTAEEFGLKYCDQHVEYVNGVVKEFPMAGGRHGVICGLAAFYLTQHTLANNLGRVFTNDTFVKVPTKDDPERVYGPDVFFIKFERLARDAEVPDGTLTLVPDLVIEVRSPFDTWTQVFGKIVDYLAGGVPLAVLIDPPTRTASVFGEPFGQRMFGPADTLTLPEVLPGFAVPVARFFE
jgi:Uma2 family endonuclease